MVLMLSICVQVMPSSGTHAMTRRLMKRGGGVGGADVQRGGPDGQRGGPDGLER